MYKQTKMIVTESIQNDHPNCFALFMITKKFHCTVTLILSEWLLNSGAYMHWMAAMPV